jgi:hypothetical protein
LTTNDVHVTNNEQPVAGNWRSGIFGPGSNRRYGVACRYLVDATVQRSLEPTFVIGGRFQSTGLALDRHAGVNESMPLLINDLPLQGTAGCQCNVMNTILIFREWLVAKHGDWG